jgi:hypothetical protein
MSPEQTIKKLQDEISNLYDLVEKRAFENLVNQEMLINLTSALVLKGVLTAQEIKREVQSIFLSQIKHSTEDKQKSVQLLDQIYNKARADFFTVLDQVEAERLNH